jgi:flagellar biosynthesis protein FliQ
MPFADALETLATALAVGLLAAILAAFTQVRR